MKADNSLEELYDVIKKYWPQAINDMTECADDDCNDSLTLNFNFINNDNGDCVSHYGAVTFFRPHVSSLPEMPVDVLSIEECEEGQGDWAEGYIFQNHLMNLDYPCW